MSIDPTVDLAGALPLVTGTMASGSPGDPASAAAAAAGGGAPVGSIASMDDLKKKARPVYDALMMSIALHMKNEQDHSQERIKKILDDAQSQH